MTDQHPVEPPSQDIVRQWIEDWAGVHHMKGPVTEDLMEIATQAARWGADKELEGCIHWLITGPYGASIVCNANHMIGDLRAARRQESPGLKEQAKAAWIRLKRQSNTFATEDSRDMETIICALEALPND